MQRLVGAERQTMTMVRHRLLVISDPHFYNPDYYRRVLQAVGKDPAPPGRLSTELALGDHRFNPFFALSQLVRSKKVSADSLVCCGDITTVADPTAMNLGWLQIHRLATELGVGHPIVAAGNHDIDSRFQASTTSPSRMLRYLDPPFPTIDPPENLCYWANGYCIVARNDVRFVVLNTCSYHGFTTPVDRMLDHGTVPDEVFTHLPERLSSLGPSAMNVLVCHHHPIEVEYPNADGSIISNADELMRLVDTLGGSNWLIIHGHRHMPSVRYSSAASGASVVFAAGSMAANLHLDLQGVAANQFYEIEITTEPGYMVGHYKTWTWDPREGSWQEGAETSAIGARGGFGYRPSNSEIAASIFGVLPPPGLGSATWAEIEQKIPPLRYMLRQQRQGVLDCLSKGYPATWESESGRSDVASTALRVGRTG